MNPEDWYSDLKPEVPSGTKASEYFRDRLRHLGQLAVLYEDFTKEGQGDYIPRCSDSKEAMLGNIFLLSKSV